MIVKRLLQLNLFVSIIIAIAFLLGPKLTLALYGITSDNILYVIAQYFGTTHVAFAILLWLALRTNEPQLLRIIVGELKLTHGLKCLFIGIGTRIIKVEVSNSTKRLEVQLTFIPRPVETPGHKVSPPIFVEKAAFGHLDARRNCHSVVSVFNASISGRIS